MLKEYKKQLEDIKDKNEYDLSYFKEKMLKREESMKRKSSNNQWRTRSGSNRSIINANINF